MEQTNVQVRDACFGLLTSLMWTVYGPEPQETLFASSSFFSQIVAKLMEKLNQESPSVKSDVTGSILKWLLSHKAFLEKLQRNQKMQLVTKCVKLLKYRRNERLIVDIIFASDLEVSDLVAIVNDQPNDIGCRCIELLSPLITMEDLKVAPSFASSPLRNSGNSMSSRVPTPRKTINVSLSPRKSSAPRRNQPLHFSFDESSLDIAFSSLSLPTPSNNVHSSTEERSPRNKASVSSPV